ncbi:4-hydroxyproline epimerase [Rosistilla carotiformis]|uniref:4-hydroxyproline epimerase n=1 Tax=Rosistilla carotiformis TaxID=2528017 RepID=A0A518JVS7_9BACT|nr:proline racemase family protein [Rosistilla carotiformis]QDV69645.1 4-hydroxyproline epimerase [Rosistilla carotiformis]
MNVDAAAIRVIDSHTGGEPTRVVVEGGPDLGDGPLPQRVERFGCEADHFRTMMLAEPRGFDAMVGALLCEPSDSRCAAAVIFFNNRGYLGMCGHGAIGVAATLAYLGRIAPGRHLLETPVGIIAIELISPNRVAIENVPSYRLRKSVSVEVPGIGTVRGDIAWGGNWFYLVESSPVPVMPENIDRLSDVARRIRSALVAAKITGVDGAEIDHIELFGPPSVADAHSRNFVLCSGGAYDRSPCGTGTSAKLACLAADGKLDPEVPWIQESIIGSRFTASYCPDADNRIVPRIVGEAYVYGETRFIAQPGDPFPYGITAQ